jgi:hypothetical protein
MHIENLGGDISHPALQNRRLIIGCFPWKFQEGEAAFRPRRRLRRRVAQGGVTTLYLKRGCEPQYIAAGGSA